MMADLAEAEVTFNIKEHHHVRVFKLYVYVNTYFKINLRDKINPETVIPNVIENIESSWQFQNWLGIHSLFICIWKFV